MSETGNVLNRSYTYIHMCVGVCIVIAYNNGRCHTIHCTMHPPLVMAACVCSLLPFECNISICYYVIYRNEDKEVCFKKILNNLGIYFLLLFNL